MKVKFKMFLFNNKVCNTIDIPEKEIREYMGMDKSKNFVINEFVFDIVEEMLNAELDVMAMVESDIEIDGKKRDLSHLPVTPWNRDMIEKQLLPKKKSKKI